RNGSLHTLTVTPKLVEEDGQKYYQIGFVFATSKPGLFSAIGMSVKSTGVMLVNMIELLGGLFFKGQGVGDITGPVGIVREVGRAAQAGIDQIITLGIVITANLGLINLIPFPALDGGRLVLLLIEGLRGKPIDARKEGYIHLVGFVVLILLMLVVTYKDIFGF
ncbi:MAG TPA: M50 family metallopeptidase, partial [Candidatus Atribacteria bacterium]|nr:M50 family metallopeptidase [Candidatus Atribacteria bacterium]